MCALVTLSCAVPVVVQQEIAAEAMQNLAKVIGNPFKFARRAFPSPSAG